MFVDARGVIRRFPPLPRPAPLFRQGRRQIELRATRHRPVSSRGMAPDQPGQPLTFCGCRAAATPHHRPRHTSNALQPVSLGQIRQHRAERVFRRQPGAARAKSASQCSQFSYSPATRFSELLAARSWVRTERTRELNEINSNHHKLPCIRVYIDTVL